MLLGLVIHSGITYGVLDYGNDWPLRDPNSTHLINDFIVYFIHSFRMPIFFVVAGFFGALLLISLECSYTIHAQIKMGDRPLVIDTNAILEIDNTLELPF